VLQVAFMSQVCYVDQRQLYLFHLMVVMTNVYLGLYLIQFHPGLRLVLVFVFENKIRIPCMCSPFLIAPLLISTHACTSFCYRHLIYSSANVDSLSTVKAL
jgi:hypothetical protein